MATKKSDTVETVEQAVEPVFTKQQLIKSKRFENRRDALNALLDDSKSYTINQAQAVIDKFMKGQVN